MHNHRRRLKYQVLVCAILAATLSVSFQIAFAETTPTASATPTSTPTPPSPPNVATSEPVYGTMNIEVIPEFPVAETSVALQAYVWFPDSCQQVLQTTFSRSDDQVYVELVVQDKHAPGVVCALAHVPAAGVVQLGPLPAGQYEATANMYMIPSSGSLADGPMSLHSTGSISFEVFSFQVAVDVRPLSELNRFFLLSQLWLPVAVLSTPDFDATTIDPSTVVVSGAPVASLFGSLPMAGPYDINGDGMLDLLMFVRIPDLDLSLEDNVAVLEGQTYDGLSVRGTDFVDIVSSIIAEVSRALMQ